MTNDEAIVFEISTLMARATALRQLGKIPAAEMLEGAATMMQRALDTPLRTDQWRLPDGTVMSNKCGNPPTKD